MKHKTGYQQVFALALGMLFDSSSFVLADALSDRYRNVVMEEIVVTAEKRDENLQNVPIAVTALTDVRRDLQGIKSVNDIADVTPGLNYDKGRGTDRVTLRGVGRLTSAIGTDPGVAIYNDGVFTGSGTQIQKSSLFVERVEILRGPQGTLYGQNSIGGAINVISKRPSYEFEAEVRGAYGNYGMYEAEAYISGALSDTVLGRLAVSQTGQERGYFKNLGSADEPGIEDHQLIELQLAVDVTPELSVWTKLSSRTWDDRRPTGNTVTPYARDTFQNSLVPNAAYQHKRENPGVADFWTVDTNRDSVYGIEDNYAAVLEVMYQWDDVTVKYLGGWQTIFLPLRTDYDGTSRSTYQAGQLGDSNTFTALDPDGYTIGADLEVIADVDKTYWSNELNFSSQVGESSRWIFGVYQYEDSSTTILAVRDYLQPQLENPLTMSSLTGVPTRAAPNPERDILHAVGDLDVSTVAGYGQIDLALADRLSLTLGVRYSIDKKEAREQLRGFIWSPHNHIILGALTPATAGGLVDDQLGIPLDTSVLGGLPIGGICCTGRGDNEPVYDITPAVSGQPTDSSGPAVRHLSGRWIGKTGRVALEYQVNDDVLLYGSYARGYKSGGFRLGNFAEDYDVDPETADAFELGIKSQYSEAIRINLALFHTQYNGAQVPMQFDNGITQESKFINLDKSRSYGAEFEGMAILSRHFSVNLSYAWLVAEIQKACCFINLEVPPDQRTPTALDGNRLPYTPEHKVSLNLMYRWPFERGELVASGSYVWRGETHYSVFNDPRALADSYGKTDVKLTWLADDYSIALYGRNITDEMLVTNIALGSGNNTYGFGKAISVSDPRLYGIEVQKRF